MKALAIFMTVLMFLTGFDLCNDDDSSVGGKRTELRKGGNSSAEQDSPCTPFCNCARCPFSANIPATSTDLLADYTIVKKFYNILLANPINISASVWQPPKSA